MSRDEKDRSEGEAVANDPLWYKDAVLYEIHVRAFADSDGDGRGDFQGLTAKPPAARPDRARRPLPWRPGRPRGRRGADVF